MEVAIGNRGWFPLEVCELALLLRLDIRRARTPIRRRRSRFGLRPEIDRLVQQERCKGGIRGRFGERKQRSGLTHEVPAI